MALLKMVIVALLSVADAQSCPDETTACLPMTSPCFEALLSPQTAQAAGETVPTSEEYYTNCQAQAECKALIDCQCAVDSTCTADGYDGFYNASECPCQYASEPPPPPPTDTSSASCAVPAVLFAFVALAGN